MNLDGWIKLVGALMPLLQILVWFLIGVFILFAFRRPLKKFLDSVSELTLKVGSVEATARTRLQAAISLGAATAEQRVDTKAGEAPENAQEIEKVVNQLVTPQSAQQLQGARVLWVDDNPSNNTYRRNALEALGVSFSICISTEDALKELHV